MYRVTPIIIEMFMSPSILLKHSSLVLNIISYNVYISIISLSLGLFPIHIRRPILNHCPSRLIAVLGSLVIWRILLVISWQLVNELIVRPLSHERCARFFFIYLCVDVWCCHFFLVFMFVHLTQGFKRTYIIELFSLERWKQSSCCCVENLPQSCSMMAK